MRNAIPLPRIIFYLILFLGFYLLLFYGIHHISRGKLPLAPDLASIYGAAGCILHGKKEIYNPQYHDWITFFALQGGYPSMIRPPMRIHPFFITISLPFYRLSFPYFWLFWVVLNLSLIFHFLYRIYRFHGWVALSIMSFFLFIASPLSEVIWIGRPSFIFLYLAFSCIIYLSPVARAFFLSLLFLLKPSLLIFLFPLFLAKRQWKTFLYACLFFIWFNLIAFFVLGGKVLQNYFSMWLCSFSLPYPPLQWNMSFVGICSRLLPQLSSLKINLLRAFVYLIILGVSYKKISTHPDYMVFPLILFLSIFLHNALFYYDTILLLLLVYIYLLHPSFPFLLLPLLFSYHFVPPGNVFPDFFLYMCLLQFLIGIFLLFYQISNTVYKDVSS